MKILAARKYPNPRNGQLSRAELETRRIAYAVKDPRSPSVDFDSAVREMAPPKVQRIQSEHGNSSSQVFGLSPLPGRRSGSFG